MKKLFFLLLCLAACTGPKPELENTSLSGDVASAHPLATKAGRDILAAGGNAFDAAIAVAATLNVVEPMMSGLGGYGTILTYAAQSEEIRFLNASGRFPAATNTDLMREPTVNFKQNRVGPKSISTPGNLNAWKAMHEQYGKLAWRDLFKSAIIHAEEGFIIGNFTERMIAFAFDDFSDHTKTFYGKDGKPLRAGDKLIQADLARTFRLIGEEGPNPFYQGELAKKIDLTMQEMESFLSLEDLKSNEAEWWEPLAMDYRGYQVFTASLPANSFAAFVNMGLMQQWPADSLKHNSVQYLHLFAEMTKESYKARLAHSFDPDVTTAPLDSLFSPAVMRQMAAAIDTEEASTFELPFAEESQHTTHFVVADQWGNIVSATQTLGNVFGSRVMPEGTGVWLNNSMAYSTFEPKGNPMDAYPGRHKLSGDCPIIILKDGKPWAALGSPGGHTITQNVPQIIFNLIDFDMSMQEAIDQPKISFAEPNVILVDEHLPENILEALTSKGHQLISRSIGNAHGIKIIRDQSGAITSFELGEDQRRK